MIISLRDKDNKGTPVADARKAIEEAKKKPLKEKAKPGRKPAEK